MPTAANPPSADPIPLIIDLDGTLIRTDMTWESLKALCGKNPLALIKVLIWLMQGRAYLKQQLAANVQIDPATLPYHAEFLAWLKEEKRTGRKLILATASDLKMAEPVARHVGLFDEVMASDGKTNLRGDNKRRALSAKFGERGYDYAGNSSVDLGVWPGTRAAIVVNAKPGLEKRAAQLTKVARVFP
jgi:phosphoserine phosphatase